MNVKVVKLPALLYANIRYSVKWAKNCPEWLVGKLKSSEFGNAGASDLAGELVHRLMITAVDERKPDGWFTFSDPDSRIMEVDLGNGYIDVVMCHYQTHKPNGDVFRLVIG